MIRCPSALSEPLPDECDQSAGLIFELEPMLDEYYTDRRWDLKRSWPTRELLDELGLIMLRPSPWANLVMAQDSA